MRQRHAIAALFFLLTTTTALATPGGFTITITHQHCTGSAPSVSFDWTASAGATSYSIVRDGIAITSITATTYEDTSVTSGDSHTYRVDASDGTGTTPSNTVTIKAPYCTTPIPPALTATVICQSAKPVVQLSWTDSPNAESYSIFRNGVAIRTALPTTTTSFTDTAVIENTTYSYVIRAVNLTNSGPQPAPPAAPGDSNIETLNVTNPCPPPPAAPTVSSSSFCGTAAGLPAPKVTITWTAPAGATSYSLFRNDGFITSTTATSYEDPNTIAGNTYTYTVYAHGEGGQSQPGTTTITVPEDICSPTPAAPVVQATSICTPSNTAAVQLSWNAAANAATYTVFRNGNAIAAGLTNTNYQDMPAIGVSVTYVVRAVNGNKSADSAPVTITPSDPCPRPPGAFTSSVSVFCSSNAPAVRVTWTSSSGATSYAVLRNGATIASGLTGTSYDDTSVADGATYSYVVRATNSTGATDSAAGGITVADPCPRPPGAFTLTASSFCEGSNPRVLLSWTTSSGAVSYTVVRNSATLASNINATSYQDTTVAADTPYTYVVRALNANGSTESSPFSITPASCNTTTPLADLAITNLALSKSPASIGETLTVSFTVMNLGNADAGETQTRIRFDETNVLGTALSPIAAGASRNESYSFIVPSVSAGAHFVTVSLNDNRALFETSFANNTASTVLQVTGAQCTVSCLVSAPPKAFVGQNVTFSLLQPPSCPVVVSWQFGNGAMSGGESATTTYNAARVYNWTVVVTAQSGEQCANAGTIEVTAAPSSSRRRAVRH